MSDVIFVEGVILKESKYSTKMSIKVSVFARFVKENKDNDWLNIEIKKSKGGKMYACLDTWKPEKKTETDKEIDDELGF
jgi:hypothetical protein